MLISSNISKMLILYWKPSSHVMKFFNFRCSCNNTQWLTPPPLIPTFIHINLHSQHHNKTNRQKAINISQCNINDKRKHQELKHFMHYHNIHIGIIQETELQYRHKTPTIPNYTAIRYDRQHGQGGGLTLITFTTTLHT